MGALASLLMHFCLQNTSGWGSGEGERGAAGWGHPGHGADRRRVWRAGWSRDKGNCRWESSLVVKDLIDTAEGNKGSYLSIQPNPVMGVPSAGVWGVRHCFPIPAHP